MHLKMDHKGRVYQAASHRADGRGVEHIPETVAGFGAQIIENPYLNQENKNISEARSLAQFNASQDAYEKARRLKEEAHRKLHAAETARLMDLQRRSQKSLLEEAVMQGLSSADFNQLSIVDSENSRREMAVLQSLGIAPQMGEAPMMSVPVPSNALEAQQAKLASEATRANLNEQLTAQKFHNEVEYQDDKASVDADAQRILSGDEMYFASEEEAKAFNAMTPQAQAAAKAAVAGKASPLVTYGIAAGVLYLLFS